MTLCVELEVLPEDVYTEGRDNDAPPSCMTGADWTEIIHNEGDITDVTDRNIK